MHVALILDEERLVHEHPTINRMTVGLLGEGLQVTRIVPESLASQAADEGERRVALATRMPTPLMVLPWVRRSRARRIREALEREPVDVLYAIGEGAWSLGADLARAMETPLALDVWALGQLRRLPRGRNAAAVAAYFAPTRSLADALAQRVGDDLVCHVPLGVAVPSTPREIFANPDQSIALAVIGGARDVPAYRALLEGLSRIIRERPQVQVFLELHGPNEHEIWRHAQRLDLLANVSAITDAALHRTLLTRCDALLMPEQYGEVRSLLFEAMAYGMPVVCAEEPMLDFLVDDETAFIVTQPEPEAWSRPIQRLVSEPDRARSLGEAGRARIMAEHRSSRHVERLTDTFDRMIAGGALPFHAPS